MNYSHIFHNAGYMSILFFLIAYQTCFKSNEEVGFKTQEHSHAKLTLYYLATSPSPTNSFGHLITIVVTYVK